MRPASTSSTRLSLRGTACALRRSPLHAVCATCRVACCLRHVSRCMLLAPRVALHAACATCRVACCLRAYGTAETLGLGLGRAVRVEAMGIGRPLAHCAVLCTVAVGSALTARTHRSHAPMGRTHRYRFSDFLSPRAPVLTALPIPHKLLGPIEQARHSPNAVLPTR
jgi:hypothetical protein